MRAALTDRLERIARRGPRALRLGEAEVVERGADGDDEVALERVLRRRDAVGVALAERGVSGSGLGEDHGGVGALNFRLVGADGHLCCRVYLCLLAVVGRHALMKGRGRNPVGSFRECLQKWLPHSFECFR